MTYREPPTFTAPPADREPPLRSGIEWGLPLGIAGAVIVIGLIFYNVRHEPAVTASHPGAATQSAPAPNGAKPATPATAEKASAPTKTQ